MVDYDMSEAEFLEQLRQEFYDEGKESFTACEGVLLNLEKTGSDSYVTELMRLIHSIKGSAKAVELETMSTALHLYETYCGKRDDEFVDISFKIVDMFREALTLMSEGDTSQYEKIIEEITTIVKR